jgi:hypothetical protein
MKRNKKGPRFVSAKHPVLGRLHPYFQQRTGGFLLPKVIVGADAMLLPFRGGRRGLLLIFVKICFAKPL